MIGNYLAGFGGSSSQVDLLCASRVVEQSSTTARTGVASYGRERATCTRSGKKPHTHTRSGVAKNRGAGRHTRMGVGGELAASRVSARRAHALGISRRSLGGHPNPVRFFFPASRPVLNKRKRWCGKPTIT